MYRVYQVQNGDTIEKISRKIGITPTELSSLNYLEGEVVEGQLLVVPNQQTNFVIYTVVKGDNIYDIAKRNNINFEDLLKINGLNKDDYIYPGQQILIPRQDISIYVTKSEETLNNIADKLQINPTDLLTQNSSILLSPDQLIIYRK